MDKMHEWWLGKKFDALSEGQEVPCHPDPRATHGFLRSASHSEDRYVCECEFFDPEEYEREKELRRKIEEEYGDNGT